MAFRYLETSRLYIIHFDYSGIQSRSHLSPPHSTPGRMSGCEGPTCRKEPSATLKTSRTNGTSVRFKRIFLQNVFVHRFCPIQPWSASTCLLPSSPLVWGCTYIYVPKDVARILASHFLLGRKNFLWLAISSTCQSRLSGWPTCNGGKSSVRDIGVVLLFLTHLVIVCRLRSHPFGCCWDVSHRG